MALSFKSHTHTAVRFLSQRLRQSLGTCSIYSFHYTTIMWVKWNRVNEQFRYEFNSSNFVDWIWFDLIWFFLWGLKVESDENKNETHWSELIFDRSLRFYRQSERFLLALLSQSRAKEVIWPCFWHKKSVCYCNMHSWSLKGACFIR